MCAVRTAEVGVADERVAATVVGVGLVVCAEVVFLGGC